MPNSNCADLFLFPGRDGMVKVDFLEPPTLRLGRLGITGAEILGLGCTTILGVEILGIEGGTILGIEILGIEGAAILGFKIGGVGGETILGIDTLFGGRNIGADPGVASGVGVALGARADADSPTDAKICLIF